MSNRKTLNDYFPSWFNNEGIFEFMTDAPWFNDISSSTLNDLFFSEYGDKYTSIIVDIIYKTNQLDGVLSEEGRRRLSQYLYDKYKLNWNRKYRLLKLEYDPLHNYNYHESESMSKTGVVTKDETVEKTNTDKSVGTNSESINISKDDTVTRTDVNDGSSTTNNAIWAFNSGESVSTDSNTGTNTVNSSSDGNIKTTEEHTNSSEHDNTDTFSGNENTQSTVNDDVDSNRELSVEGFNGRNITYQDLIRNEIEIWKWNFFDDMFCDIANVITIPIYNMEVM